MDVRILLSVAGNAALLLSEIYALIADFRRPNHGVKSLRYFTIDSNILAGIAALIMIPAELVSLLRGEPAAEGALLFKFIATAAVSVTMFTVLVFLGPTQGYGRMLSGPSLWLHALSPILAILTFVCVDGGAAVHGGLALTGLIPVVLYGMVYTACVLVRKCWEDFYGFNKGGKWYIAVALMVLGTVLLSYVLAGLNAVVFG